MSRYQPVYMRHKRSSEPDKATSRNLAVLGLRIAAMLCWVGALVLCITAVLGVMDSVRAGTGLSHWQPFAMLAGAIAALVVGWRIWALKLWACVVAVVATALLCLFEPWRQSLYPGAILDVPSALAASITGCVIFVAPLVVAIRVARTELHSGF